MHKPKAERQRAGVTSLTKGREARWKVSTNQRWVFIRDCVHKSKAERPDDRCHFSNQRQREGLLVAHLGQ